MKQIITILILLVLAVFISNPTPGEDRPENRYQAQIMTVENITKNNNQTEQIILAKFLKGPYAGKSVRLTNEINGFPTDIRYSKGDLIFVQEYQKKQQFPSRFAITGPVRERGLYLLLAIFAFSVMLFGGFQGIRALISLAFICIIIFYFLIPLVIKGYSPILITLILSAVATIFSLFFVSGINRKTLAAIIGTISGVAVAGLLVCYFGDMISLLGYSDESLQILQYSTTQVDYKGLLFSGIIIGALGAVMDVAMSISSAITEIKESNPAVPLEALISSGFKVGKDIIGTMTNTLILAYVGSSFPLLMLYHIHQTPYSQIINHDAIAGELVRMLTGSIGLLAVVPVTTFIAALLHYQKKQIN